MTPADAAAAVEGAIATAWAAGPNTPIAWPNVAFVPPTSGSWLKVDWIWGNGQLLTKTGRLNGVVGVLQLAVFGPTNGGDGVLGALAETARNIVNRARMGSPSADVLFGATSGPVGMVEASWRSLVMSTPFQVQEVVP